MNQTPSKADIAKFVIMSVVGAFLFLVPIPDGEGAANIPLGYVIGWLGEAINSVEINGFGLLVLITTLLITASFLASIVAYLLKPSFIMENERLKHLLLCHPVYLVSKGLGALFCWMVFLDFGPEEIMGWGGATLMLVELVASDSGLVAIFIILGFLIPILTDFGIMEFVGIFIRKVLRTLFTVPGRGAIDLITSWFSSSAVGVMVTRNQHERGFYTHREAANLCVNFCIVSLPFAFVVASTVGLSPHFGMFYLTMSITAIILAIVMPRIWPLRGIKDEYLAEVGKQIDEEVPPNTSMLSQAVRVAGLRANKSNAGTVVKSGFNNYLDIFLDLIPVIMAWGTLAMIIEAQTPIFDWLSWPFGQILQLFQVPGALEYAPATVVGFIDMFIPALMLGTEAPIETRFILGVLSVVQIIYMAETGVLILKSKIPLNFGHLVILFLMRTIIALPIIILLTRLLFNP
ncbi:MAG: hypothetical protein FWG65_00525 [Turicibacter sp.]|nr:hypothetical protein [Turicibacter sp.]